MVSNCYYSSTPSSIPPQTKALGQPTKCNRVILLLTGLAAPQLSHDHCPATSRSSCTARTISQASQWQCTTPGRTIGNSTEKNINLSFHTQNYVEFISGRHTFTWSTRVQSWLVLLINDPPRTFPCFCSSITINSLSWSSAPLPAEDSSTIPLLPSPCPPLGEDEAERDRLGGNTEANIRSVTQCSSRDASSAFPSLCVPLLGVWYCCGL